MPGKKIGPVFRGAAKAAGRGLAALTLMSAAALALTERPLQGGEIRMARGLFGGELDVAGVRVNYLPFKFGNTAGMALFNRILVFGADDAGDFTKIPATALTPAHELAHLWQYQNGMVSLRSLCLTYDYKLTPGAKFGDFCFEQQAAMVASYYLRFLCDDPLARPADELTAEDRLLQEIVEDRLPQARHARILRGRKMLAATVLESPMPSAPLCGG